MGTRRHRSCRGRRGRVLLGRCLPRGSGSRARLSCRGLLGGRLLLRCGRLLLRRESRRWAGGGIVCSLGSRRCYSGVRQRALGAGRKVLSFCASGRSLGSRKSELRSGGRGTRVGCSRLIGWGLGACGGGRCSVVRRRLEGKKCRLFVCMSYLWLDSEIWGEKSKGNIPISFNHFQGAMSLDSK